MKKSVKSIPPDGALMNTRTWESVFVPAALHTAPVAPPPQSVATIAPSPAPVTEQPLPTQVAVAWMLLFA